MVHNLRKSDWPKETWQFPLIHEFEIGFGLSAEATTKAATIVPYVMQDNALVDYELIKTNPHNADFATVAYPNVCQGSYIPKCTINWTAVIPPSDTEIVHLKFDEMLIATSFLNRLDASDKKTGLDVENLLELTHETTDEQCYPLWNGTKLFESGGTFDYHANVPGLTTNGQPEGVAWDKSTFFKAMHYYTNKEMLKQVTFGLNSHTLSEPLVPHGRSMVSFSRTIEVPSIAKSGNEYQFLGQLFGVPQVGSRDQYHLAGETTAIEHFMLKGFVKFFEFNPGYNFARA